MTKKMFVLLILSGAIFAITAFQPVEPLDDFMNFQLRYEGRVREYGLHVPPAYDPENGGHLLLVLHGGGMSPLDMRELTGQQFDMLMADHNGIVVYPAGVGQQWNDGRKRTDGTAYRENIDDVGFLVTLIDKLAADYQINPNEVYMTGFSNGAGMSYRFACEQSNRVVAIAPVSGLLAETQPCQPDSPVAVLAIMGDADPLVPLTGGELKFDKQSLGTVHSLTDTLAIWQPVNNCEGDTAQPCTMPLRQVIVENGGHTWPGTPIKIDPDVFGPTSNAFDATAMIFDFMLENGLGAIE